ncbi:hypothetical protein OG819_55465 [Streptomyces sp. NBC_01549]|uniref:hypothetical protein n=1 Tax=unclassified Streptomyces TaxID=2593676 RepID=UPI00224D3979|nr:hypothetical protein [Streptomyces sp. NBC_01549]MCX4598357.1 hypothetical protein [Streptomyces sp. NBC_01549]
MAAADRATKQFKAVLDDVEKRNLPPIPAESWPAGIESGTTWGVPDMPVSRRPIPDVREIPYEDGQLLRRMIKHVDLISPQPTLEKIVRGLSTGSGSGKRSLTPREAVAFHHAAITYRAEIARTRLQEFRNHRAKNPDDPHALADKADEPYLELAYLNAVRYAPPTHADRHLADALTHEQLTSLDNWLIRIDRGLLGPSPAAQHVLSALYRNPVTSTITMKKAATLRTGLFIDYHEKHPGTDWAGPLTLDSEVRDVRGHRPGVGGVKVGMRVSLGRLLDDLRKGRARPLVKGEMDHLRESGIIPERFDVPDDGDIWTSDLYLRVARQFRVGTFNGPIPLPYRGISIKDGNGKTHFLDLGRRINEANQTGLRISREVYDGLVGLGIDLKPSVLRVGPGRAKKFNPASTLQVIRRYKSEHLKGEGWVHPKANKDEVEIDGKRISLYHLLWRIESGDKIPAVSTVEGLRAEGVPTRWMLVPTADGGKEVVDGRGPDAGGRRGVGGPGGLSRGDGPGRGPDDMDVDVPAGVLPGRSPYFSPAQQDALAVLEAEVGGPPSARALAKPARTSVEKEFDKRMILAINKIKADPKLLMMVKNGTIPSTFQVSVEIDGRRIQVPFGNTLHRLARIKNGVPVAAPAVPRPEVESALREIGFPFAIDRATLPTSSSIRVGDQRALDAMRQLTRDDIHQWRTISKSLAVDVPRMDGVLEQLQIGRYLHTNLRVPGERNAVKISHVLFDGMRRLGFDLPDAWRNEAIPEVPGDEHLVAAAKTLTTKEKEQWNTQQEISSYKIANIVVHGRGVSYPIGKRLYYMRTSSAAHIRRIPEWLAVVLRREAGLIIPREAIIPSDEPGSDVVADVMEETTREPGRVLESRTYGPDGTDAFHGMDVDGPAPVRTADTMPGPSAPAHGLHHPGAPGSRTSASQDPPPLPPNHTADLTRAQHLRLQEFTPEHHRALHVVSPPADGDCLMNAVLHSTFTPRPAAPAAPVHLHHNGRTARTPHDIRTDLADVLTAEMHQPPTQRPHWTNGHGQFLDGLAADEARMAALTTPEEHTDLKNALLEAYWSVPANDLDSLRLQTIQNLRTPRSWDNAAGEIAPALIANIYQLEITIIMPDGLFFTLNRGQYPDRHVTLLKTGYEANHWVGTRHHAN